MNLANVNLAVEALRHDLAANGLRSEFSIVSVESLDFSHELRRTMPDNFLQVEVDGEALNPLPIHDSWDDRHLLLERLADMLQDELVDRFVIWPACPNHSHPMVAELTDAELAQWRCPKSTVTVSMGQLLRHLPREGGS